MRQKSGMAWLLAAGVLAGCQGVDSSRPPTVRFGEDACAFCRMIISDDRFAAAIVTETGDVFKFDDIGCLLQHEAGCVRADVTYWVKSFQGSGWLTARDATFVHSADAASPMGHGLLALPTAQAAKALAAGPGSRTLQFSALPRFVADSRQPVADSRRTTASVLPRTQ
jgi:copper chaperone NosL